MGSTDVQDLKVTQLNAGYSRSLYVLIFTTPTKRFRFEVSAVVKNHTAILLL